MDKVEEVRVRVKAGRLGASLEKLVGQGGLELAGVLTESPSADFIVKLAGEGAKKVATALGFEVVEDESAEFGALPEEDVAAILAGDPPKDPDPSELGDIPEAHVVIITPDSFERDFTGTDLPVGSIACSILTPFSPVEGVEYVAGKEGKCKFDSALLAAKVVAMGPRLAAKVARDVSKASEALSMEKVLSGGRCLALLLRGNRGYGTSLRNRLGPKEMQGGR